MDFGKLFGRAKQQAGKHSDQVHKGVDKAQDLADKHLDDKYDGHIEKAGDMVEKGLGLDPQPGNRDGAAPAGSPAPAGAERPDGSR